MLKLSKAYQIIGMLCEYDGRKIKIDLILFESFKVNLTPDEARLTS